MNMGNANYPEPAEEIADEVNLGVVFLVVIVLLLVLSAVIFFGGAWVLPPTTPAPKL